jgi:hypothetical protein
MPRLDGTGPRGQGPITGRGLGPCGGGYGRGRGMGYGRGYGLGLSWNPWSYRQPTATEEKTIIRDDIAALKEELKAAEEHLSQIEGQK